MAETTDDRLRLLIERVERLEEEKKGIADDIKDVYLEAKAVGYDPKIMRQIVRLRKMTPDNRNEMEAQLDLYKCALGLGGGGYTRREPEPTPLEVAIARATDEELAERGLVRIGNDAAASEAQPAPDAPPVNGDPYDMAVLIVRDEGKASASFLQRRLGLGYNSASKLIERMEAAGIVGPADNLGRRQVLAQAEPA